MPVSEQLRAGTVIQVNGMSAVVVSEREYQKTTPGRKLNETGSHLPYAALHKSDSRIAVYFLDNLQKQENGTYKSELTSFVHSCEDRFHSFNALLLDYASQRLRS